MRDSFIFYRSFYESLKELPGDERLKVIDAIMEFSLNEIEPQMEGISKAMFILIKPQLQANISKYKNGCKQKGSKKEANNKQTQSKPEGNDNDNDNDNDNENENAEFSEIKNQLTDEIWKETFCINSGINSETFDLKMNEFLKSIQITGEYKEKNMLDLKSHFLNIIRKNKTESKPKPKYPFLTKEESFKVQISPNDHAVWLNDEKTKWQRTGVDEKGEYVLLKGEKNYLN